MFIVSGKSMCSGSKFLTNEEFSQENLNWLQAKSPYSEQWWLWVKSLLDWSQWSGQDSPDEINTHLSMIKENLQVGERLLA